MTTRRELLAFAILPGVGIGVAQPAVATPSDSVVTMEAAIRLRLGKKKTITTEWIAAGLRYGLDPAGQRIAAFELVRNIPYRLTAWTGDPDSLFNLQKGDCRHKAAATVRLLKALGNEARQVVVIFDWADLPIPVDILNLLPGTRSLHDSVEVKLGQDWAIVDPTWNPTLAAAGFPVTNNWNGLSSTRGVTNGKTIIVRPGELPSTLDIYDRFKVDRPQRQRTQQFNRAFNTWLDGFDRLG